MRLDNVPLKRIKKALRDDGVWVSPAVRGDVSRADERRIEKAVNTAKPRDVYVALVEVPYDDPMLSDVNAMFTIISDDTGMNGTFVGMEDYDQPAVVVHSIGGDETNASYAELVANQRNPDDLTDQVVDAVELIDKGDALEVYNRLDTSTQVPGAGQTSIDDLDDGPSSGLIVGLVIAAIVVIMGIGLALRGRRQRPANDGFNPPANVLSTVRAAERRRLLKRAKHDVLSLGEHIDAATMEGASDAWQAALDHYDHARRLLDRSHQPADVVGAIVLVERGSAALGAALAGHEWSPATPCYFNPLHGRGKRSVRWGGDQGSVDVPGCKACADAINGGRTPDALDFVRDGVPHHYFTLDLEPWSSTGYGALDPDLLGRVGEW